MRAAFQRKQIVWGKIEPYPWWPGKIISMHIQSEQIVYKILFFADPTYAYLQQSQLLPFQDFDRNTNPTYPKNTRLNKAIKMADQSYGKIKMGGVAVDDEEGTEERAKSLSITKNQSTSSTKQSEHIITTNHLQQHSLVEDEHQQETDQLKENFDRIRSQQTMINLNIENQICQQVKECIEEITADNVIEILQNRMRGRQRCGYNYEDRKNAIRQNLELKHKLLQKYNLHQSFDDHTSVQLNIDYKIDVNSSKLYFNRKKKHIIKRSKLFKQNKEEPISQLQDKCLRKLYQYARRSLCTQIESNRLKLITLNSIKKLAQLSQNNPNLFKHMYVNLVRFVQRLKSCQIQQLSDLMIHFNGYFDRFENDKNEQEQGSKMTQISIPYS